MSKKNVVITGAGSGLGASLAKQYSEMGYHVALLGRTKEKLEKTAALLVGESSIYILDVANNKDVVKTFALIKEELGAIDILLNNAGLGVFDLAENITEQATHDMIDINLKGTIFCTQAVLSEMKERNEGIIANIISTAGKQGKVTESVYCASKFGVRGFTESLNQELQDTEIRVYGAYMSGMKTDFWDGIFEEEAITDFMDPDDIADIIIHNIKPRKNLTVNEVTIDNK